MRGCDFAWGVIPGHERALARALKAQGFGFVVRYLGHDPSKNLTRAEVAAYRAEGLKIVTVYEDAAATLTGGAPAGRAQALTARAELARLGAPEHAPVYFAADFAASPDQIPVIDAALDATAFVLTEDCNGIYGDYAVTSKTQHVRYRWQTVAWSAGRWDRFSEIDQFSVSGRTDGVSWDLDESKTADFGQWEWPSDMHRAVAPPKRHLVRKAAAPVRRKQQAEPVIVNSAAAGGLMAAVTVLAAHAGIHLTAVQAASVLAALPALAGLVTAFQVKTEHAFGVALTGLAAAGSTAAVAFGYSIPAHQPLSWLGASAPVIAAGLAWIVRGQVTPRTAAGPAAAPVPPPASLPANAGAAPGAAAPAPQAGAQPAPA